MQICRDKRQLHISSLQVPKEPEKAGSRIARMWLALHPIHVLSLSIIYAFRTLLIFRAECRIRMTRNGVVFGSYTTQQFRYGCTSQNRTGKAVKSSRTCPPKGRSAASAHAAYTASSTRLAASALSAAM